MDKVKNISFVDLDNTTLDNVALRIQLDLTLKNILGLEETNEFWNHYENCRENSGLIDIPFVLLSYFKGDKKKRDITFENIDYAKCKYTKVEEFIKYLKLYGQVILFSEGNIKYQSLKAQKSGIGDLCDKTLIFKDKLKHLDEIKNEYKNQNLVFFDDKPKILEAIKTRIKARVVLVKQGYYSEAYKYKKNEFDFILDNVSDLRSLANSAVFV